MSIIKRIRAIIVCVKYHNYTQKDLRIIYTSDIEQLIFLEHFINNDLLKRVKTDGHKLTINFSPQSLVYLVMKG